MKRYKVTQIMNTKQLGLMLVAGLLSFGASAQVNLNPVGSRMPAILLMYSQVENTIAKAMGTDCKWCCLQCYGSGWLYYPSRCNLLMRALTLEVELRSLRW